MLKIILSLAFAGSAALAQATLNFEAASVKPATPPTPDGQGRIMMRGPSGGPGTKDPGRISYPFMSLKNLLMIAYDVKNYQISGPSWLDSERFDITATMPPDTTKEQFHVMLQNLIAERFKMTLHHEKKELPMYSLVINKGTPKLKESTPAAPAAESDGPPPPPPMPNGPPKMGPDGFPILPGPMTDRPGIFMMMMPGRARLTARLQTMQDLADRLTSQLNRAVIDNTGLTAKYDFVLTYAPEPNEGIGGRGGGGIGGLMVAVRGPGPGPTPGGSDNMMIPEGDAPQPLLGALQSQLGLKLEPKRGDVDTIVIDKMEKTPIEN